MATKLLFNRKKKLNKKGEGLIEVEIYISSSNRSLRSTGVWVNPKFWDNKNKVVKAKHPQAQVLNAEIQTKKQEFDRFILTLTPIVITLANAPIKRIY